MSWSEGGPGQAPLPSPYYIDIVTKRYFDGVDNKRMDQVLDCFTEDAILTEQTSQTVHNGKAAIRAMFDKLFSDFSDIWHGNFVHTADPDTNAVCSQFTVLITPNGGEELRRWVDDPAAKPGDLDAAARADEKAWVAERKALLLYS